MILRVSKREFVLAERKLEEKHTPGLRFSRRVLKIACGFLLGNIQCAGNRSH